MAVRIEIQRLPFYNEFTPEEQEQFFGVSRAKVLHNVDNLYFTCRLNEVRCKKSIENFIVALRGYRDCFRLTDEPLMFCGNFEYLPFGDRIYRHCLHQKDEFDILIAESMPNEKTPRIRVQIRAILIWSFGIEEALRRAYLAVEKLAGHFDFDVLEVNENRIDWCYHTNSIQNTTKFFGDKRLIKNLNGTLTTYKKVGKVGDRITVDYLSLGRRGSKVFFRAYNKTREVIEKGYKGIFIGIWRENKLISEYDKYVLEYAYRLKSYSSGIALGKIAWYLEFGRSDVVKAQLEDLRQKYLVKSSNMRSLDKRLSEILPDVTQITNIEFETYREYYKTFLIPVVDDGLLGRINWILKNRKCFLDDLTSKTVRFVADRKKPVKDLEDKDYLYFWRRIRSCKLPYKSDENIIRVYQRDIDIERAKADFAGKVATLSVLQGRQDDDFIFGVADALTLYNDNDMNNILDRFLDFDTGELASIDYANYDILLGRKRRQYKFLLDQLEQDPAGTGSDGDE